MSNQLSDTQIWQGYFVVTDQQLLEEDRLRQAIQEVTPALQIQRLREDVRTTDKAAFCFPDELNRADPSITGRVVLVRIVSEPNAPSGISLDFMQWEGSDVWFVSTPATPKQCYQLTAQ